MTVFSRHDTIYSERLQWQEVRLILSKKKPSKDELSYPYNMIAEAFSMETAEMMFKQFNGQQITFPRRFVSAEITYANIMSEYENGVHIRELVRKYDVSESMIRRLITRERKKQANPETNQIPPQVKG